MALEHKDKKQLLSKTRLKLQKRIYSVVLFQHNSVLA